MTAALEKTPLTSRIRPGEDPVDLKGYESSGGYRALKLAIGKKEPEEITSEVKKSVLRGRGGAGFPTGLKWESMLPPQASGSGHRYIVANADEMEPGTFKDRILMEGDPHLFVEGMILAAYAVQADIAYMFLRSEYKLSHERLRRAIDEAYERGYLGKNILGTGFNLELYLHSSAGRYICGEETSLLNALEGKRAIPRSKPPYPGTSGLFGRPTVVNNVETLSNIPLIVEHGADWFLDLSLVEGQGGTKLYGVSGNVNRPGCWELPLGTTVGEILEHAGGMKPGYRLRGILPGGASTDFLTSEHLDVKMDFASVQKVGSRMGTGTMIILDDRTCPVGMVLNLTRFFARASCGWCTPCREGLPWVERLLESLEFGRGEEGDLELLEHHCRFLAPGCTFCALAPGAMEPLQSALKHFREDFIEHTHGRCRWREEVH